MRFAFRNFIFFALICGVTRAQVNPHTNIRWPASCSTPGLVYSFQSNSCIAIAGITWRGAWNGATTYTVNDAVSYLGGSYISTAAGNTSTPPSATWNVIALQGPAGPPGWTSSGSGTSQVDTAPGSFMAQSLGGSRYAIQWQTPAGTGNNGIANSAASGQTVVADPSYSSVESFVYGFNSFKQAPAVIQSHVIDYRNGLQIDTYRDPAANPFNSYNAGHITNFQNYLQGGTGSGRPMAEMIYANFWAPGASYGAAPVGPTNWTVGQGLTINQTSASPGIHEGLAITQVKTGIGDNVGAYFYNTNYGGAIASADEGNHGIGVHGDESITTFKGTVKVGGGGVGATTIKITCTLDCNTNSGGPGDGRYLVDQSVVLDSGNIVTYSAPSGQTPGQFTLDHSITPSTAIGTLNGSCNAGAQPVPVGTGYNTVTCSVNLVSGAFVANNQPVCFNSQFHEQALITSITGSGPYSLTMNLRHAHGPTSMIAQGGPCGSFLDITANDAGVLHFPIDIIGAPDATHYYWTFFYLGNGVNVATGSPVGGFGALSTATQGATNLTNIGGVVYFGATLNTNAQYTIGATTYFSNASGGLTGYNGACTNTKYTTVNGTGQFYCAQASSIGLGVAATATAAWGTSQYGNSAYTVWAGAEVLDVLDHSVNPPVVYNANTFTLTTEPNNATWANGDTVEEAHHYALRLGNTFSAIPQNKMLGSSEGMVVGIGGPGSCCGNFSPGQSFTNSYQALQLSNQGSTTANYKYHGGFVTPPGGIFLNNTFNYGLAMITAPDPFGSPLIYSGCPISGCNDIFYYYYPLMVMGNGSTQNGLRFTPNASLFTTQGNWVWGSDFGKQTFRDSATFSVLAAPTLSTPTTAPTGGNLADATTYYYTVYAANNAGLGLQSAEKSVTTGSPGGTSSNSLTWNFIPGATIYWVCRSTTSGAETRGPGITVSDRIAYIDNGTNAFSGGACNTVDTSRAGTDNAAYAGIENANGTTQTKIGPGAATTNITVALPAVAGTLALLASPAFTGTPTAPTPATADNSTTLATTAYVKANVATAPTKIAVSITPGATAASSCVEQAFNTFTGLATGQGVYVSPPALPGTHVWIGGARVSAANTLAISFCADATGGTAAAGTYTAVAF